MSKSVATLRTCLGCREEKEKRELVRLVASPEGEVVIDYKGNLPGRGAYICPREACIRDAFSRKQISRAFKGASIVQVEEFIGLLRERVLDRLSSLLSLSRKAGKAEDGREIVEKGLAKGSIRLLLLAEDVSAGSFKGMTEKCDRKGIRYHSFLSKDKIGALLGKDERGAVGITDESFAQQIEKEIVRLRSLGSRVSEN